MNRAMRGLAQIALVLMLVLELVRAMVLQRMDAGQVVIVGLSFVLASYLHFDYLRHKREHLQC